MNHSMPGFPVHHQLLESTQKIGPSNYTPQNLLKGNENIQAHKLLSVNVHSSMIHKSQTAVNWQTDEAWYIHAMEYCS